MPSAADMAFMSSVAAGRGSIPAGRRTTDSAGTTTSSAYAPPWGPCGMTKAMTGSPSDHDTPSPVALTVPDASMPGT